MLLEIKQSFLCSGKNETGKLEYASCAARMEGRRRNFSLAYPCPVCTREMHNIVRTFIQCFSANLVNGEPSIRL